MSISVAQQERGPPVTKAGLAPLGPWAVFVTWDRPTGADVNDLWGYKLNFGHFVVHIPATTAIMFHPQGHGITPGGEVTVKITALYNIKGESNPIILTRRALVASKF